MSRFDSRTKLNLERGFIVTLLLLSSWAASAHEVGLSEGRYEARVDGLDAELSFARADVEQWLGDEPRDAASAGLLVFAGGDACALTRQDVRLLEEDGAHVSLSWTCPSAPTRVAATFVALLDRGHRHVALTGDAPVVLHRATASFGLGEAAPSHPVSAYLALGVEHILIGADHLAFLFALVLIGLRRKDALLVVTAFTVGHSVTLALAALDLVALSPAIVEPLIAASVAWVGIENLVLRDARARWRLAAPFGLLHGLGFAGVLSEIGLPAGGELGALALFNAGVEVGQLLVLALVLPALSLARRSTWFREVGTRALSAGLVGLGLVWLLERVV
jgi:hydrogenase/urease accessory protein HupE